MAIWVNGRNRVPDFNPYETMRTRGTVVEVKDTSRIYASSQLRDLHQFATELAEWEIQRTLIVRPIP